MYLSVKDLNLMSAVCVVLFAISISPNDVFFKVWVSSFEEVYSKVLIHAIYQWTMVSFRYLHASIKIYTTYCLYCLLRGEGEEEFNSLVSFEVHLYDLVDEHTDIRY